jgi:hypothetical protein
MKRSSDFHATRRGRGAPCRCKRQWSCHACEIRDEAVTMMFPAYYEHFIRALTRTILQSAPLEGMETSSSKNHESNL